MALLKDRLRELRDDHNLLQRQVAAALGMDNALYNKIEKGERPIKEETLRALAIFYGEDFGELRRLWVASQIYSYVENDPDADQILNIAAECIAEYGNPQNSKL